LAIGCHHSQLPTRSAYNPRAGLHTNVVAAILTVGQNLFSEWQDWMLALVVSVSVAVNLIHDEDFHIGQVPFARDLYHLEDLRRLERNVVQDGAVHLHALDFRLPIFRTALIQVLLAEAHLLPYVEQPQQPGRVLVVEDQTAPRSWHEAMLNSVNRNVAITTAGDGNAALMLATQMAARGTPFDLVMIDLVLRPASVARPNVLWPGESSGLDFAEAYRDAERAIAAQQFLGRGPSLVVLVTGTTAVPAAHKAACKIRGADVIVPKPLDHEFFNAISTFFWAG